jgi:hypothetical protein
MPRSGIKNPAAEQDNNFLPPPGEIHPVTRSVVDAEFGYAVPYRPGIAEVTGGNAADTGGNNR